MKGRWPRGDASAQAGSGGGSHSGGGQAGSVLSTGGTASRFVRSRWRRGWKSKTARELERVRE